MKEHSGTARRFERHVGSSSLNEWSPPSVSCQCTSRWRGSDISLQCNRSCCMLGVHRGRVQLEKWCSGFLSRVYVRSDQSMQVCWDGPALLDHSWCSRSGCWCGVGWCVGGGVRSGVGFMEGDDDQPHRAANRSSQVRLLAWVGSGKRCGATLPHRGPAAEGEPQSLCRQYRPSLGLGTEPH